MANDTGARVNQDKGGSGGFLKAFFGKAFAVPAKVTQTTLRSVYENSVNSLPSLSLTKSRSSMKSDASSSARDKTTTTGGFVSETANTNSSEEELHPTFIKVEEKIRNSDKIKEVLAQKEVNGLEALAKKKVKKFVDSSNNQSLTEKIKKLTERKKTWEGYRDDIKKMPLNQDKKEKILGNIEDLIAFFKELIFQFENLKVSDFIENFETKKEKNNIYAYLFACGDLDKVALGRVLYHFERKRALEKEYQRILIEVDQEKKREEDHENAQIGSKSELDNTPSRRRSTIKSAFRSRRKSLRKSLSRGASRVLGRGGGGVSKQQNLLDKIKRLDPTIKLKKSKVKKAEEPMKVFLKEEKKDPLLSSETVERKKKRILPFLDILNAYERFASTKRDKDSGLEISRAQELLEEILSNRHEKLYKNLHNDKKFVEEYEAIDTPNLVMPEIEDHHESINAGHFTLSPDQSKIQDEDLLKLTFRERLYEIWGGIKAAPRKLKSIVTALPRKLYGVIIAILRMVFESKSEKKTRKIFMEIEDIEKKINKLRSDLDKTINSAKKELKGPGVSDYDGKIFPLTKEFDRKELAFKALEANINGYKEELAEMKVGIFNRLKNILLGTMNPRKVKDCISDEPNLNITEIDKALKDIKNYRSELEKYRHFKNFLNIGQEEHEFGLSKMFTYEKDLDEMQFGKWIGKITHEAAKECIEIKEKKKQMDAEKKVAKVVDGLRNQVYDRLKGLRSEIESCKEMSDPVLKVEKTNLVKEKQIPNIISNVQNKEKEMREVYYKMRVLNEAQGIERFNEKIRKAEEDLEKAGEKYHEAKEALKKGIGGGTDGKDMDDLKKNEEMALRGFSEAQDLLGIAKGEVVIVDSEQGNKKQKRRKQNRNIRRATDEERVGHVYKIVTNLVQLKEKRQKELDEKKLTIDSTEQEINEMISVIVRLKEKRKTEEIKEKINQIKEKITSLEPKSEKQRLTRILEENIKHIDFPEGSNIERSIKELIEIFDAIQHKLGNLKTTNADNVIQELETALGELLKNKFFASIKEKQVQKKVIEQLHKKDAKLSEVPYLGQEIKQLKKRRRWRKIYSVPVIGNAIKAAGKAKNLIDGAGAGLANVASHLKKNKCQVMLEGGVAGTSYADEKERRKNVVSKLDIAKEIIEKRIKWIEIKEKNPQQKKAQLQKELTKIKELLDSIDSYRKEQEKTHLDLTTVTPLNPQTLRKGKSSKKI